MQDFQMTSANVIAESTSKPMYKLSASVAICESEYILSISSKLSHKFNGKT